MASSKYVIGVGIPIPKIVAAITVRLAVISNEPLLKSKMISVSLGPNPVATIAA